ncbi:labd-13Z-ene-9,15,16-triol synthase, chloroplastic-like [Gossypium arboreum]|uniref:Flavonoid 3'-monooxygenase-like n=1 Tax=Gossypium arboreum TaxID=29729 RepID=A0ABR0P3I8_GOSAR|nr:labd-13Z-ene-9,15,16-triol synthase, chloroplastic-like [Gossypium arboreum]KAK5813186.1 hypothetical protein PVK06_028634 [Gossypium arboreum]
MLRRIFVHEMQSNANLDAFYAIRRNQVKKSIKDVYGKNGTTIDVRMLAYSTVINMMTSMFWGGTLEGDIGANINAQFRDAVSELLIIWGKPNISDFFPFLASFDIQGIQGDMKRASRWMEKIFDFVIDPRTKNNTNISNNDFLDFLLEFKDHETGKSLSRPQIKALSCGVVSPFNYVLSSLLYYMSPPWQNLSPLLVIYFVCSIFNGQDIVIGGTGTTSTSFEWTMAELMLHPEVMKKTQEELTKVVGDANVVEEYHFHKLPYLQAVVKETLRLHPSAPLLLPRCPSQTCTLGGYTIPKGAKVFLNAWAMHRDSQLWENPYEFRPERFVGDSNKLDFSGNKFHYIPFGSGRRMCAGLHLGERMLMYTLATFLHMFHWKVPDGEKPDTGEKFGIVLEKSTPLIVLPTPRLNNLKLYH